MSIEKEDTIILTIQKSAHAHKAEVDTMTKEIAELEASIATLRGKLVKKAEQYREALDYLTLHQPDGADDWFKHMGTDRDALLKMEAYNNKNENPQ